MNYPFTFPIAPWRSPACRAPVNAASWPFRFAPEALSNREFPDLSDTPKPLTTAISDAAKAANKAGVYVISWDAPGAKRGEKYYIGQTDNLKKRLQQHKWCLEHLGIDPAGYRVQFKVMEGKGFEERRNEERKLIRKWKGKDITNKLGELEIALWEGGWH